MKLAPQMAESQGSGWRAMCVMKVAPEMIEGEAFGGLLWWRAMKFLYAGISTPPGNAFSQLLYSQVLRCTLRACSSVCSFPERYAI
jgi:hypothetical protein